MTKLLAVVMCSAVVLAGCQRGDPSGQSAAFVHPEERRAWWSRPLAMANADAQVMRQQLNWGPIDRVFEPAPWRDGMWWQINYHPPVGEEGPCIILVDANSGWARLPPSDYAPRVMASPGSSATSNVARPLAAPEAPRGTWVLQIDAAEYQDDLPGLALQVNDLARSKGLPAIAVVRMSPSPHVVYGWQGDYGMEYDPSLVHWLQQSRPAWRTVWIDLAR